MAYQTLKLTQQAGVLSVFLNRPDVRNAFNDQVIEELSHVFEREALEETVRIVVLRGEGKVFSAGGDLNWMRRSVDFSFEENLKDTRKLAELFYTMNHFEKPLVGVVHGAAIGGGVGLVSVCDIVLASREAQFSLSEVRLGIIPACIGPFVVEKIGASQARRLFVSGERIGAEEALRLGLVHQVVDTQADLDGALDACLDRMRACGPKAMASAKRLVLDLTWPEKRAEQEDVLEYVARMLAEIRISDEGQEGVRAFLEKRAPQWLEGTDS